MSTPHRPVLVYDRIARNRLITSLLLTGLALALLPIALALARGLTHPTINKAFWLYVGPQPSRRELLVFDLLWGQGGVVGKLRTLALDLLWAQGVDARLRTIAVIIGASILVCVTHLVYRHAGAALALRVARARRVQPGEERPLVRTVENLCIGAGLPRPRLYVIETAAANAFSTGWDPAHATIVVTHGLLARLERRELEAVLAHELSHIGNYDTRLATLAGILSWGLRLPLALFVEPVRLLSRLHPFAGMLAAVALLSGSRTTTLGLIAWSRGPYTWDLDLSDLGVLLVFFIAGLLIQRAIARQREYLADAEACLLTRAPGPLARALAKLAAPGGLPMRVNGAFSHLYVTDPFVGAAPWWDRLFSTHPPLEVRLARLAEMGGTPVPAPASVPEGDLQGDVPEAPADRVAPRDVRVADVPSGPDPMLIGLTVAGAIGAVALLLATSSVDPVSQLLSQLLSAFLQVVVFTTALYVAHVHRIPDWTFAEWWPGGGDGLLNRLWVGILAMVAICYHPFVYFFDYGTSTISPGLALFPAGVLLFSRMWPLEFWGEGSAVSEEAALEVAVRESGATHPVRQPVRTSPIAGVGPPPAIVPAKATPRIALGDSGAIHPVPQPVGPSPVAGVGPSPAPGPVSAASGDAVGARFRLTQQATLYPQPDAGGPPLAQLPIGAGVVVQGGAGGFLRLISPDGVVGYVARWTAMMRVDNEPSYQTRGAPAPPRDGPISDLFDWFDF